jgi:hypothetical protein
MACDPDEPIPFFRLIMDERIEAMVEEVEALPGLVGPWGPDGPPCPWCGKYPEEYEGALVVARNFLMGIWPERRVVDGNQVVDYLRLWKDTSKAKAIDTMNGRFGKNW